MLSALEGCGRNDDRGHCRTSLDNGTTWRDITVTTFAVLSSAGGDRFRAVVTSTGTQANTTFEHGLRPMTWMIRSRQRSSIASCGCAWSGAMRVGRAAEAAQTPKFKASKRLGDGASRT